MRPVASRVRPLSFLLVALGVVLLCGLGVWQLQRLAWKTDLLRRVAALQTAPARPLGKVLGEAAAGRDVDFTRVRTVCPGLERTPALRLYAVRDGVVGDRLITACAVGTPPYRSILLDRGFIAQDALGRVTPSSTDVSTPVVGVLRRGDAPNWMTPKHTAASSQWYGRDVPAMAAALHAPAPAPLFLMLASPAPRGFGPTPAPLPADIPNPHLGYAITWFGLAATLVGFYLAVLIRPHGRD